LCGLFGIVKFSPIEKRDHSIFQKMSSELKHRGPDGSGFIEGQTFLLGMHRLSIMDLGHGWQPFWSEDESIGALGNGEIYNYLELKNQLIRDGCTFRTGSDIEIIPHLYQKYGEDAFSMLRGMYVIIILDKNRHRIVIVRDRMGEKPLAYVLRQGELVFASEQNALIRSGAVPFALDQALVPQYLSHGYIPEPLSIVSGVRKLPAGHKLEIDLVKQEIKESEYWSIWDSLGNLPLDTVNLSNAIRDAVEVSCSSDVPLGVALSGGTDSSLIAHYASLIRPDLRAFSIGYNGTKTDESKYAREFACHLGIPITVTHLDAREIGATFADVCAARDEPISDIAGPAISAVSRAAAEAGVPVLLNGIGGDEFFWGYDWVKSLAAYTYGSLKFPDHIPQEYRLRRYIPPRTKAGIAQWIETLGGNVTEHRIQDFFAQWTTDSSIPLALYEFQPNFQWIHRQIAALLDREQYLPRPELTVAKVSELVPSAYINALTRTYLQVNNLAQMDRLSMHFSIEARTPLVDHKLIELIMSSRSSGDGGLSLPGKTELRAVAERVLPAKMVSRRKRGFTPPIKAWIKEIWKENRSEFGYDSYLASSGLMNQREVLFHLNRPILRSGRINQIALRLGTLELWARNY
jgi:asparagine synthase (glutamine-hydrolysing)